MSSKQVLQAFWLGICLISIGGGCAPRRASQPPAVAASCNTLRPMHQADHLTVLGCAQDKQAIQDIAAALRTQRDSICSALNGPCPFPVTVRVYPDQQSLDAAHPGMKGYYAFSGGRTIDMVSPRNPAPHLDIPYEARVQIAVHEFVHLVNNEINPDMPLWLNEGAAIYMGPHDVYAYVCAHQFPFDLVPSFADLEHSYASTPAADLFSYTVVDFIAARYGLDTLNILLRAPDSRETVLGLSRADLDEQWQQYMETSYQ